MNTRYYRKKKKKKNKERNKCIDQLLDHLSTIFSQLVFCKPVDK